MSAALADMGGHKEGTAAALPESLKQMYPLCLPLLPAVASLPEM